MKTTLHTLAMAVLTLALPPAAAAQAPEATTAPTVEDLAWITGTWSTDLDDQVLEERWSPPMANAMTGSFRWARDGEVWLYEFLVIEETDDGIFYYMRHFSPGSVGWEEREAPLAYRLETLESDRAVFASTSIPGDSFVFARDGQQLTIEVVSGDDTKRFVYTAAEEGAAESAAEATNESTPDQAPVDEATEPDLDQPSTAAE